MAHEASRHDRKMTISDALKALRTASRDRHAALPGTPEYERADAEERRLGRLVWTLADVIDDRTAAPALPLD